MNCVQESSEAGGSEVLSSATALERRHIPCGGLDPLPTVSAFQACAEVALGIRALTDPPSTLSARWAFGSRMGWQQGAGVASDANLGEW